MLGVLIFSGRRHVAQGESITLTRWGSRVQIPACLPFAFRDKDSSFVIIGFKQKGISKFNRVMPFYIDTYILTFIVNDF